MSAIDHELVADLEFDALLIQPAGTEHLPQKTPRETHRYPAKLHAKRVAKFLSTTEGVIYLRGARSESYPDSDQDLPLRQARYFYYVTGANEPDFEVTYDLSSDRLVLWIPPPRAPRDALYNGDVPSIKDCLRRYDVDDARYAFELPVYLESRSTTIFALHAAELPNLPAPGLATMTMTAMMTAAPILQSYSPMHSLYQSSVPSVNTTSLQPAMDAARIIKTPYEISMIRRACAVSARAHRAVAAGLKQMYSECNIEATFASTCTNLGARTQAYPIIAGSGENASRLHYDDNAAPLLDKQLVVLDAGCEWKNYASDITRTLPLGGRWRSVEAQAIHDLVAEMQDAAIDMMRPGAHWLDFVEKTYDVGLVGLHRLGLLRGDLAEILTSGRGVMAAFFPHGLGHPVGLEVHDFAAAWYKRAAAMGASGTKRASVPPEISPFDPEARRHRDVTRPNHNDDDLTPNDNDDNTPHDTHDDLLDRNAWLLMREGMVLTIEPGIYFNRAYIEAFLLTQRALARYVDRRALDRFWAVGGCRIEDVVLITAGGCEVLSVGAPKGRELWDVINGGGGGY